MLDFDHASARGNGCHAHRRELRNELSWSKHQYSCTCAIAAAARLEDITI
jgi:hypothetical protein